MPALNLWPQITLPAIVQQPDAPRHRCSTVQVQREKIENGKTIKDKEKITELTAAGGKKPYNITKSAFCISVKTVTFVGQVVCLLEA